jgi:hypothetical protein
MDSSVYWRQRQILIMIAKYKIEISEGHIWSQRSVNQVEAKPQMNT